MQSNATAPTPGGLCCHHDLIFRICVSSYSVGSLGSGGLGSLVQSQLKVSPVTVILSRSSCAFWFWRLLSATSNALRVAFVALRCFISSCALNKAISLLTSCTCRLPLALPALLSRSSNRACSAPWLCCWSAPA